MLKVGGDRINFLDITIIKNRNGLEFDWYHFSGKYLSAHPMAHKKGTVMA